MKSRILIIDDEPEITEIIEAILTENGFEVDSCLSPTEAEKKLAKHSYDIVVSDIHMPGKSGLKLLDELSKSLRPMPKFIFVSGNSDPTVVERAAKLGAADVIQKPFDAQSLIAAVNRLNLRANDKIYDLMEMIRGISGITLGDDKRALVETRLLRRTRQLGIISIDEYYEYFKNNRDSEVSELVSLITTHTTQFFRESGHFDYLMDTFFPDFISKGHNELKIWSAASSSGEEAYSLAMCYFEFLKSINRDPHRAPKLKVFGSDIDFNVVEQAKKGIYTTKNIERIDPVLIERYFDRGSGTLSQYVRIKDFIHKTCQFRQINLIGRDMPSEAFDLIFLRNVLIYFKPDVIKQIIGSLGKCLTPGGLLFLGHSESLSNLDLPFEIIGNSIYQARTRSNRLSLTKPSSSKTRVFIIDDSATIRKMLRTIFQADPCFEVVGEAEHPQAIKVSLSLENADVVTLDIHMPVQDGISYLRSIQGKAHPAVVMISSVNYEDGVDYMNCLELGAVDYIEKPSSLNIMEEGERIRQVVKAAKYKGKNRNFGVSLPLKVLSTKPSYQIDTRHRDLIVIGASTGGVEALRILLQGFPEESPPIIIVQHIPKAFSKTFAERLHQICPVGVSEAKHGELLEPSHAYIAPGGTQLKIVSASGGLAIAITDDAPVNRHKPSVDYMFRSVVPLTSTHQVTAVLLTGMGDDGARGLLELKNCGAHTIAQDEESSVVFGMPRVAIELKAASEVLPLNSMAYHIFKSLKRRLSKVS